MWFRRKEKLDSKEYLELKGLFSTLSIQIASLEASFTNLTTKVLKKIRNSRPKDEELENIEADEKSKSIYNEVFLKE